VAYLDALRSLVRFGVDVLGSTCDDAVYSYKTPRAKRVPKAVDGDQIEKLIGFRFESAHPLHRTSSIMALSWLMSGARASDVGNLKWEDVEKDFSRIRYTSLKTKMTLSVKVDEEDRAWLYFMRELGSESEFVLPWWLGCADRSKAVSRQVGEELKHAGYSVRTHDVRRHYARRLAQAGVDTVSIAQACGWKSVAQAWHYTAQEATESRLDDVRARIGKGRSEA